MVKSKHSIWTLDRICDTIVMALLQQFDFFIVLDGKRGCLTGDTEILTTKGVKKIKDIEDVSDLKAFDLKNMEMIDNIAFKVNRGKQEVYEIKTSDGRIIKSTLDHKFYVVRNKKIIKLQLKDIKEGDELLCSF